MDLLQQQVVKSEQTMGRLDERLGALSVTLSQLVERLEADAGSAQAMDRLVDSQNRLTDALAEGVQGIDAESRMRLRSIDVQMLRLLEEIAAGRQETLAVLHKEIDSALQMVTRAGLAARRGPPLGPTGDG